MGDAKDMAPLISDAPEEPTPTYWEFVGSEHHSPGGIYATPWVGEVQVGRVYEVRDKDQQHFVSDPCWQRSSRNAFDAQDKE